MDLANNLEEALDLLQKAGYTVSARIGTYTGFYVSIENKWDSYSWDDEAEFLQNFRKWL